MQSSYGKVLRPTFFELGYADLVSIYSELCELENPPPVIDAEDLQRQPEVNMCILQFPHVYVFYIWRFFF